MNIINQYFHISLFNLLLLAFASFAWTRVFVRFRSGDTTPKWFIFWSVIWFGLIVIIFLPGKADFIATILGVSNGPDALLTVAVVFLFYTAYRLYAKIDGIEEDLSRLTRFITLNQAKTKHKK